MASVDGKWIQSFGPSNTTCRSTKKKKVCEDYEFQHDLFLQNVQNYLNVPNIGDGLFKPWSTDTME